MVRNFLQEKLSKQQSVIGSWSVIPSAIVADIISSSGLDFLILDAEHGPASFELMQTMIIACESRQVSPVVRVSSVSESEILKALDIGAHCIHVPNVTTKEDVTRIIEYAKYPPLGNRGFSPFTRAGGYSSVNGQAQYHASNSLTLIAIHIEGQEVLKQLDSILATEGIDILFVGLFDLSKSLGMAGDIEHPEVLKLYEQLTLQIRQANKVAGTIVTTPNQMQRAIQMGIQYITYSVDCDVLLSQYRSICSHFAQFLEPASRLS